MSRKVAGVLIFGVYIINFAMSLAGATIGEFVRLSSSRQVFKINEVSKEVCETPACVLAATQILDKIDRNVQPCDDFYRFVCGRYIRESVIPDDKHELNLFYKIFDKVEEQLKEDVRSEARDDDPKVFKQMLMYYSTCMNIAQIEKTDQVDLLHILKKLGGWPVLEGDSWDESNFDWIKSMYKFRRTGYPFRMFFQFDITVDLKNNSRHIIKIDTASLPMSRVYLLKGLKANYVKERHNHLVNVAVKLGADRQRAEVELQESLNFAIELAKICLPKEERRNSSKLYNLMTIAELEFRYPAIPWTEYMNEILAPHTRVHPNEKVVVAVPSFFDKLSNLVSRTPKRVLANFAMAQVIGASVPRLGGRFQKAKARDNKLRWKKCLMSVLADFSLASDALYVRRHFDESAKAKAVEIIDDIRSIFRQLLIQADWMGEKTRIAALEKLDAIVSYVGYPDEFLNNEKLDEYFKYIKVYPESFLRSSLSAKLHATAKYFDKLRKPVNKTDWIKHGDSANVNARYEENENSIDFPAAILQGEFFSKDRPNYLNYGAIGFVMGHEITHGFDDMGRQYDKDGNLVNWWDPETEKKFLEKAKCIIKQYSNYTVNEVDLNINGVNTQGENIADHGGMKGVYFAYNDWEKRHGQEPQLPGLPYTSQQMLWISTASTFCSKYQPDHLKTLVLTDEHSPDEFRINGVMSNLPEFSNDFQCLPGSPMNPVKKCTVW